MKTKEIEKLPCPKCGSADAISDSALLEFDYQILLGGPFDYQLRCSSCGWELFTVHFHGRHSQN
jgi:predicted RNA-binding Zn-ribbon protein involved in translation (DUF1610 family)